MFLRFKSSLKKFAQNLAMALQIHVCVNVCVCAFDGYDYAFIRETTRLPNT